MKKELDSKVVIGSLVGLVVVAGAILYYTVAGPGARVPASENVEAMSNQYQSDLQNRGGAGSEAEMRQQTPPQGN